MHTATLAETARQRREYWAAHAERMVIAQYGMIARNVIEALAATKRKGDAVSEAEKAAYEARLAVLTDMIKYAGILGIEHVGGPIYAEMIVLRASSTGK